MNELLVRCRSTLSHRVLHFFSGKSIKTEYLCHRCFLSLMMLSNCPIEKIFVKHAAPLHHRFGLTRSGCSNLWSLPPDACESNFKFWNIRNPVLLSFGPTVACFRSLPPAPETTVSISFYSFSSDAFVFASVSFNRNWKHYLFIFIQFTLQ